MCTTCEQSTQADIIIFSLLACVRRQTLRFRATDKQVDMLLFLLHYYTLTYCYCSTRDLGDHDESRKCIFEL